MPARTEFEEFEANPLQLRIGGKVYEVPPIGIKAALILSRAVEEDQKALRELSKGDSFFRLVLGEAYEKMLADNVPHQAVDRAALTATVDFRHGRAAALTAWRTGQDPEALAALVAAAQRLVNQHPGVVAPHATKRAVGVSGTKPRRSGKPTTTNRTAKRR